MNKLEEICAAKRAEVERRKRRGLPDTQPTLPRGFRAAIEARQGIALIAEIKRASPSRGLIRPDFEPAAHARAYQAGGASCLSILTDEPYFQGHDDHLIAARAAVALPCLRKDFLVDPWQVAESRALGADAILIIVAALSDAAMAEIEAEAIALGMDALIEVHDRIELDRALKLRSRLIGVNNRDLRDFSVDLNRTIALAAHIPEGATLIAESGIGTPDDLARLARHGVKGALVGESLMRQPDLEAATRALLSA